LTVSSFEHLFIRILQITNLIFIFIFLITMALAMLFSSRIKDNRYSIENFKLLTEIEVVLKVTLYRLSIGFFMITCIIIFFKIQLGDIIKYVYFLVLQILIYCGFSFLYIRHEIRKALSNHKNRI
jgi:amino acid permease